jgi:DNA-binding MarR family transcriptional regulator
MGQERDAFEERASTRVVDLLGPGADLDTFAAAFTLFRLSTEVINDLESRVHRPRGLSIAGFRVLFTVWVMGELEPREIARLSGVSRAAVSGVLATLERSGWIIKTKEQADRRLITVRLTGEGERVLQESYSDQQVREAEIFGRVGVAELRAFTATMRSLLASASDSSGGSTSTR